MDIKNIVLTAVFGLVTLIIIRFWDFLWTPFKVGDDMDQLRKKMASLRAKLNYLKAQITKAEIDGKTRSHEVGEWMKQVVSIEHDVTSIDKEYIDWRSNFKGLRSYLIFWERIRISYQVFKKLKEVTELHDQGGAFKEVATDWPPPAAQEMTSAPRVFAMDSNRDKILDYLNNDEVEIIGIWGMGGVGKTTLLEMINNFFAYHNGRASFDHVIFVKASNNVSPEDLQQKILDKLRLTPVGSGDITSGATKLLNLMNERKVLLLLDNLWAYVDLHSLGIPLGQRKCKVVFTTRGENLCNSMKTNERLKVECLEEPEDWSLFKECVGESIIEFDPNIKFLAGELCKECRGLPLALVTVGKAMSKMRTQSEWKHAFSSWQRLKLKEIPDIPNIMFQYWHSAMKIYRMIR